jgi:hypothetical protein
MELEPNAILENNDDYTGYYGYKRQTIDSLWSGSANWGWGLNERVLRLGDVYLMYAEALFGVNNTSEAQIWFDKIRERAGLDSKPVSLDNIKLERRLELASEGHRFYDLVRWGDAGQFLEPLGFKIGVHEHYPIPQEDIDRTNGVLIQRDGY